MERYHTLYFVSIIGPAILGLLALALIALPGESRLSSTSPSSSAVALS